MTTFTIYLLVSRKQRWLGVSLAIIAGRLKQTCRLFFVVWLTVDGSGTNIFSVPILGHAETECLFQ